MNKDIKAMAIAAALTAGIGGSLAVANLSGQLAPGLRGDFKNAAFAEVRDAQGQVLLSGNFTAVDADDEGEVERLATLTAASGSGASGEAEVEYQTDNPAEQEIEWSLTGLRPGTAITLMIDGQQVATATADKRGRVEIEFTVQSGS